MSQWFPVLRCLLHKKIALISHPLHYITEPTESIKFLISCTDVLQCGVERLSIGDRAQGVRTSMAEQDWGSFSTLVKEMQQAHPAKKRNEQLTDITPLTLAR